MMYLNHYVNISLIETSWEYKVTVDRMAVHCRGIGKMKIFLMLFKKNLRNII